MRSNIEGILFVAMSAEMSTSLLLCHWGNGHKLRIVHYNPDTCRVDGKTRTASQKERITKLLEALEEEEPKGI